LCQLISNFCLVLYQFDLKIFLHLILTQLIRSTNVDSCTRIFTLSNINPIFRLIHQFPIKPFKCNGKPSQRIRTLLSILAVDLLEFPSARNTPPDRITPIAPISQTLPLDWHTLRVPHDIPANRIVLTQHELSVEQVHLLEVPLEYDADSFIFPICWSSLLE